MAEDNDQRQDKLPDTRPKSDRRQRTDVIFARVTPEEKAAFVARAHRAGLASAAFLRAAALGEAGPRAHRRRPVEHRALVQALAALNRVGNNLNQIARSLNAGQEIDQPELRDALQQYSAVVAAIYDALGMEPSRDNKGQEPGWP
jgi:hypothetical protein